MSKRAQHTKETIVSTCIDIIRAEGADALSARSICKKLGCSVAPLFWAFGNMDELMCEVRNEAQKLFTDHVADSIEYVPAFKEFGMRLIRFSREDPNLFHYLFLEKDSDNGFAESIAAGLLVQNASHFGLTPEQSHFIWQHIWPFACGLALLSNKNPEQYSEDMVSQMLSSQFQALVMLAKSDIKVDNITPTKIKRQAL